MISLLISLAVLIIGYLVYGKVTEKVFAPDDRQTPAIAINDGVDCVPMKPWKSFLIPLLVIGGLLTWYAIVDDNGFQTVWRYFSWSNQTLAMIALWVSTAYLLKKGKYRFGSLITALPATFMSAVSMTYILMAEEGLRLSTAIAYPVGAAFAAILFIIYLVFLIKRLKAKQLTS